MKLDLVEQLENLEFQRTPANTEELMFYKKRCQSLADRYAACRKDPDRNIERDLHQYADELRDYALIQYSKDMDATIRKLNDLHKSHPEDSQVTLDLALVLFYQFHRQYTKGKKLKALTQLMDLEKENPDNSDLSLLACFCKITGAFRQIQSGYGLDQSLKEAAECMQHFPEIPEFKTLFALNLLYLKKGRKAAETVEKMMADVSAVLSEPWSVEELARQLVAVYRLPVVEMQRKAVQILRSLFHLYPKNEEVVLQYAILLADENITFYSDLVLFERVDLGRSLALSFPENEAITGQYARLLAEQTDRTDKKEQEQILNSLQNLRQRFPQSETIAASLAQSLKIHAARSSKPELQEPFQIIQQLISEFPCSAELLIILEEFLEKHYSSLPEQQAEEAYLFVQKQTAPLEFDSEPLCLFRSLCSKVSKIRRRRIRDAVNAIQDELKAADCPDNAKRIELLENQLKDKPLDKEEACALGQVLYESALSGTRADQQKTLDLLWEIHDQFPRDEETALNLVRLTEQLFKTVHPMKQCLLVRSLDELTEQFEGNELLEEMVLKMMAALLKNTTSFLQANSLFDRIMAITTKRDRRHSTLSDLQADALAVMIRKGTLEKAHQCYQGLREMARTDEIDDFEHDYLDPALFDLIYRDLTSPAEDRQEGFDPMETLISYSQEDPQAVSDFYKWFQFEQLCSGLEDQIQMSRTLFDYCQKHPENKLLNLLTLNIMSKQAEYFMVDDYSAFLDEAWSIYQRYPDDAPFILGMAACAACCAEKTLDRSLQIHEELERHLPARFETLLLPSRFMLEKEVLKIMADQKLPEQKIQKKSRELRILESQLPHRPEYRSLMYDAFLKNPEHSAEEKDEAMTSFCRALCFSAHPLEAVLPAQSCDLDFLLRFMNGQLY